MANAPAAGQALAVLRLLARHTEPVPASAIARDLLLPRSSVYHLLKVLCDQGFVVHLGEERRYGLGVAAFELGSAYTRQAPLQRLARQPMVRLVDATRYNAHLAVLHGRDVLYVIEERAPGRPPLVTDVGVRLPSQLTASGLAMLASLPPQQVRALFPSRDAFVQRHGGGPASLPALRAILSRVRREGFALEDGTVTPDLASVAAPVLDHGGHPVAGIAVTYPAAEISASQRQSIVEQVIRTATDLTRRVGGKPDAREARATRAGVGSDV
jgi:DNA-binding IclR family transcriptional regulator